MANHPFGPLTMDTPTMPIKRPHYRRNARAAMAGFVTCCALASVAILGYIGVQSTPTQFQAVEVPTPSPSPAPAPTPNVSRETFKAPPPKNSNVSRETLPTTAPKPSGKTEQLPTPTPNVSRETLPTPTPKPAPKPEPKPEPATPPPPPVEPPVQPQQPWHNCYTSTGEVVPVQQPTSCEQKGMTDRPPKKEPDNSPPQQP